MGRGLLSVFMQETLATKLQYILFLGIAYFCHKPFVAAAHTSPTKATLIRLADTATWACRQEKLQPLSATSLPQMLQALGDYWKKTLTDIMAILCFADRLVYYTACYE